MRTLLTVAVSAVLLVAIGGAQRLMPDADRTYQPMASKGAVGQEVRSLPYSVRVNRVQQGRELRVQKEFLNTAEKKVSQGVWVVVDLTATATQEQVQLGDVELESANGTRYGATDRFPGLDGTDLEAGIAASGSIAFELPPEAVNGATLLITNPHYASIHRRSDALGSAVRIDLGLTGVPAPAITIKEQHL